MLLDKFYKKLYFFIAVVSWVILTILTLYISPSFSKEGLDSMKTLYFVLEFFLVIFITSVLLYYKTYIASIKEEGFSKILLRLFIWGASMISILAIIWISCELSADISNSHNHIIINILNNLSLITVVVFMSQTFYVFKKMITYQKTRNVFRMWNFFEYAIYFSLPLVFVHFYFSDKIFQYILIIYFVFGLVLSVNQNWIVYFSLKQKWNSVLLTSLILVISLLFIFFIQTQSTSYGSLSGQNNDQVIDIIHDVPIVSLFVFIVTYCISSILVILFNLPISSAFERKFKETSNFQQLSQMIQMGDREDKIYPVLMETSINIVMADAAWLDIYEEKEIERSLLTHNIDKGDIRFLKVLLERKINLTLTSVLNLNKIQDDRVKSFILKKPFKSALYIPLTYGYEIIGELVLIRDLYDAYDKQLINSVKTYVDQAVSSIINSRLLKEAIENQRYQEEKKIAKEVKEQLIQDTFPENPGFSLAATTKSSGDVGGDYFDFAELSEGLYAVAIADVSGSGITAAFNMAQLRGIFKTLVLTAKSPKEFVVSANKALSSSLSKTSFITFSLFFINTKLREVKFVRAGHCPSILYENKTKQIRYLNDKGLGLGILRSDEYEQYVSEGVYQYEENDILVLFTDGLIELRNKQKEEYGYDNFSKVVEENINLSPKKLIDTIFDTVISFQGHDKFSDDLSCLIVKFK